MSPQKGISAGALLKLLPPLLLVLAIIPLTASDETIRYELSEEVAPGTKVGNVVTSSGIKKLYQKHEFHQLEFRFLTKPQIPLAIGTSDGIIRTTGVIDRDVMPSCRQSAECDVNLDVTVQPVDYFRIIKVTVRIIDINDNPPRFTEAQSMLAILESASVGSAFLLPSATDADSPKYGVSRYDLIKYSSKFGLKVTPKLDGFLDVRLTLLERLDRETQDEYWMTLVAFDGGVPPKSDSLNITAKILDSNDNDPVFDRQNYDVSIVENTSRNTTIATVLATDADIGSNGHVMYEFSAQTRAMYGHVFAIDNMSGSVTLREDVDREAISVYQLIVTAEDQGPDSHPVDVSVMVTVEDANDNHPDITVNTLAEVRSDHASVSENSPRNTFVAHVTVFDPDSGSNGSVSCTLNDPFFLLLKRSLIQQSETEYQIVTAKPLDREMTPAFNLTLDCSDDGTPSLRRVKHLVVNVLDENDNPPLFSQEVYRASIVENNYIGMSVVQVVATDADSDESSRLHFSIVGPAADVFSVNSRGLVAARTSLDREDQDSFRFYVQAVDGGNPAKTGSTLVEVTIEDVNDESPVFHQSSYSFSVLENEDPGTPVGETSAVDADGPPFDIVRYSFLHENLATDCFSIDPLNGTIATRCQLDREDQPVYHLAVAAIDRSTTPSLTSSASLIIYVEDVNDNAPYFEYPSMTNNTVYVSNRAPVGHVVTTLQAKDKDEGVNAQVGFQLQSGNEDGMFHLDTVLGTVFVNRLLSGIDFSTYRLLVVAEDHGSPQQLMTSAHLNIVVNKSIPFHDSSSSLIDSLPHHGVMIIIIVVGCACSLVFVALVLWCLVIRPRRSHQTVEHRHVKSDRRSEGLRMLQAGGKNGTGGCSSTEGTPVKRPLVFSSKSLTNNNFDHLNHCERKSFSSADGGFYGDGYQGNGSDVDDVTRKETSVRSSGLRSTLSVTSSDVWPLTTNGRGSNPGGYYTYDRRFITSGAAAPRVQTFTLPPHPPRIRDPEVAGEGRRQSVAGAPMTSSRQCPSGGQGNCFYRAEQPVYTNSLAVLQSQHTLLI